MLSETAVQQVWLTSLVIYFVVVGVVAALLTMILISVRKIHAGAAAIWTTGQKVANNTIHIPLLVATNHIASRILASAVRTLHAVGDVERHAAGCPGCPACVLGTKGGVR